MKRLQRTTPRRLHGTAGCIDTSRLRRREQICASTSGTDSEDQKCRVLVPCNPSKASCLLLCRLLHRNGGCLAVIAGQSLARTEVL